jgi:hypothetical protein
MELGNQLFGDRRRIGRELAAVCEDAPDVSLFDRDFLDLPVLDVREELTERDLRRRQLFLTQDRHQEQDHDEDDDPEGHVLVELLIHWNSQGWTCRSAAARNPRDSATTRRPVSPPSPETLLPERDAATPCRVLRVSSAARAAEHERVPWHAECQGCLSNP